MTLEKFLFKKRIPGSESEKRKVFLGGYFLFIAIGCNSFFLVVNFFNPKGSTEIIYLSVAALYSVACLILLRNGFHNAAIIAQILFVNGLVFLFTYLDPDLYQTGTYIFFILNAFGALSIFGFKELWKGVSFTLLSFTLFLISIFQPDRFHPADPHFYLILNYLFILLVGSLILLFYDRQVIRSENLLQLKNDELKKINSELDRFVYSASHDLRAPLSSIQGLINLYQVAEGSERDKMVELIQNRVLKLDDFIREIIQYSRNARVDLTPVEFNLYDLIQKCWEDLRYIPQASNINFDNQCDSSLLIVQDPDRLRIVLENLISNGIKYSRTRHEGSFIKINAGIMDSDVIIEVIDNGVGISQSKQEKVFEMFYRGHEISDGSGLGLFIVSEILQKMNGQIKLDSNEGTGSRFKILLPLMKLKVPAVSSVLVS
jgi:signal transduction histidine kinase